MKTRIVFIDEDEITVNVTHESIKHRLITEKGYKLPKATTRNMNSAYGPVARTMIGIAHMNMNFKPVIQIFSEDWEGLKNKNAEPIMHPFFIQIGAETKMVQRPSMVPFSVEFWPYAAKRD